MPQGLEGPLQLLLLSLLWAVSVIIAVLGSARKTVAVVVAYAIKTELGEHKKNFDGVDYVVKTKLPGVICRVQERKLLL